MLDSPSKKQNKDSADQGQILWRGSNWLLLKPGADIRSIPRAQSLPDKTSLDELAAGLKIDSSLRDNLKNTLRALDKNLSSAETEPEAASSESDILEIILYIVDLVKNGQLLWLPLDAIESAQNHRRDELKVSDTKTTAAQDSKNQPPPPKAKPRKILKRKTTIADNSGPQTPSQLLKSVHENNSSEETPVATTQKETKSGSKPKRGQPTNSAPAAPKTNPANPGAKSLIDLFTYADATTGEPVSRWLGFTGVIPGDGNTVVGDTVLAQEAYKIGKKPGKLGNGKVSPKNAELRTQNCPISVISGEKILEQIDFELPGPIPLRWQRIYRTSHSKDLGLGVGWSSLLLSRLDLRENEIIYCDAEGREIPFDRLPAGKSCHNSVEQLTLYCDDTTVYRIIDAGHTILTFGGSGKRRRLYEITDREGHAIKLFYSANDRLIQVLDSAGRRLKLDYNIADQLRRIYLCSDNGDIKGDPLVEYCYNNDRELIKVIDAMGNSDVFEYRYHLVTRHTTKDGFNIRFEWDEYTIKGKCTHTWGDGDTCSYRFKYDETNKITRSTDTRGNTCEYHYNDLGLITTKIDPEGGVSQYTYNEEGRILSKRNPIGATSSYGYDDNNRLIRYVNATGGTSQFVYDRPGNLIKFTDPLEQNWEKVYDNTGRIIVLKDPNGQLTQFNYIDKAVDKEIEKNTGNSLSKHTEATRICIVTNTLSHTQQYEWNDKGELLAHTSPIGKSSRYTYDELGRVTKIMEARDKFTHLSYDRRNNITQIIHPSGASVQMLYNANGSLTQYVDAVGRTTRYKYDGLNQLVERCDAQGRHIFYVYDKQSTLVAVINENGERYELQYDKNGRLVQETGFDGRIQKYNYDAAGHVVRHLDGANRVTSFKRDALGRLLQKRTSTGEITQFEYDALGQLVKAHNSHNALHFRYNCHGRVIDEAQNNYRIRHQYNISGQKTHVTLADNKTIRYDYDDNGLLTQVYYDDKILCTLEHDHHGRVIRRDMGSISSQFDYDAMGRLMRQSVVKNKECIWERQYRYDKTGNLRQIDDTTNGKVKFHFDAVDRLNKVEGAAVEAFIFDPAGNLLDSQYPEPLGFVPGNRLRVFQNFRFEYDDVGNMVRQFQGRLETRFYYNVTNQLVRAYKNGQTVEYTYDPLGRRCKKTDAASETVYLWDGDVLIQELRNALDITYIHEPDELHPICQIRNGDIYFYHTDHLGTPHLITDVKGKIVWQASYQCHGIVNRPNIEAIDNPIRFPGQYHDPETGLHYSRHRYFHPVTGRYIHQHPLGLKGGINPYEYAPNPLGWVNPLGLEHKKIPSEQPNRDTAVQFFKIPSAIIPQPSQFVGDDYPVNHHQAPTND